LAGVEVVVEAAEGEQFVVGALFHEGSGVEDEDVVGVADDAEAVGGAIAEELGQHLG